MKILNYRRHGNEWTVVRHKTHDPSIDRVNIVPGSYRGDLNYLNEHAALLKYVLTYKEGDVKQDTKYLIDDQFVSKEIFLSYIEENIPTARKSIVNH